MIATTIHKIANSLAAFFGRSIQNRRVKPGFEQAADYAGIAATFDANAKAQCDEAFGPDRRPRASRIIFSPPRRHRAAVDLPRRWWRRNCWTRSRIAIGSAIVIANRRM
jgi:hypothetical protein